ncbi:MAG: TonB-dependent receptor, partial [Acidobacteria bacterium]|nr:TonB-dependent receptor [Acidobacteriota bacterium]
MKKNKHFQALGVRSCFMALALLALLPASILSQVITGTLVGTVRDSSGAVVAGAKVKVTNQNTGISYEQTSNEAGNYVFPYLPPGMYRVSAESAGFRTAVSMDNSVKVSETTRVNFGLVVGEITETIEVRGDALQLQTETSSVQNVIEERVIQTVPNITHNPFYYASLQPGVVGRASFNDTQGVAAFGIGSLGRRFFSALSINGGQAFTNDIQLDGLSTQGSAWNEAAVLPNPEGIQEVRTIINNFSAEYGRAQGVISIRTKSGTNEYHGSVFYRSRNEAFNANSFGANARGIPRDPFKVHSYGGAVGGPIQKDKAFFFVSYEGLNHKRGEDFFRTVPTERERRGDFSQTLVNVSGVPTPLRLFDPFNVTQIGPNVFQRAEFPNAIIPNPNPFMVKLFSFYGLPNRQPDDVFNTNNYFFRGLQTFSRNSVNARFDYKLGRHSIYLSGGISEGDIITPSAWGPENPFYSPPVFTGRFVNDANPYISIGDTVVFSPTLVLDLRYGINRVNANNEAGVFDNFDYDQFGIPKEIQAINALPGVAPAHHFGICCWSPLAASGSLNKRERQTNHGLVSSMTKIHNRWTFKLGGEFRNYLSNYTDPEESFMFQSQRAWTQPLTNAVGGTVGVITPEIAGHDGASLLTGAGWIHVAPGRGVLSALSQKYLAFYSQNDWRASSRLTLNLGLRWELQPGPTDRFDRLSSFDAGRTNPFATRGAFAFPGTEGYSRNLWNTHSMDFGPRVGLAYRLTQDFVIRAGYGLTYLPTNTGYFAGTFTYGADSFAAGTEPDAFGPRPAGAVVGPFSQVTRVTPVRGADPTNPLLYGNPSPRFVRGDYLNGRVQQWNLFLERKLGSNWLVAAGYVASKGDHLPYARLPVNSDQFIGQTVLDSWRADYIARNGRGHLGNDQIPSPFQPAGGPLIPFGGTLGRSTLSRRETLLPYPHFGGMQQQTSLGFSNYHALQLQVNRSLASGLLLNAHYTWSKSLGFSQTEVFTNAFGDSGVFVIGELHRLNLRNNYSLLTTDIPHRLLVSYVYELPFGAGKRFTPQNRVIQALVSGWRTGGVFFTQSGLPMQIVGGANGALNGRPNRLAGVPIEVPKELQRWYDGKTTVTLPSGRQIRPCNFCFLKYSSDAFQGQVVTTADGSVANDIFWYGNAALSYNDLRTFGQTNWNASLERTFRLKEGISMEFSAQATNVLNHTQFRPPGVN